MRARAASRLAWSLWGLALLMGGALLALTTLTGLAPAAGELLTTEGVAPLVGSIILLVIATVATMGALVASRRSGNPVGWLLLVAGLSVGASADTSEYVLRGLTVSQGSVPGADWAALASNLFFLSWVTAMLVVFWVFPTGGLPSRRWRPFLAITLGCFGLLALAFLLVPGAIPFLPAEIGSIDNPMGIEALRWARDSFEGFSSVITTPPLLLTLGAVVVRFRRSRGEERQQMKWLMYAGAISAITLTALDFVSSAFWDLLAVVMFAVSIPVVVAIAIFRFRLYDIDRIVNRTLVYGLLTALLAGLYVGGVIGLGAAFESLTGQSSALAVAISTLAVAALFRPARSKIQGLIDRRFYRRRYDAARALEAFSITLRDEVDLDALNRELVAVVEETMQPAHVSVWLRTPETDR